MLALALLGSAWKASRASDISTEVKIPLQDTMACLCFLGTVHYASGIVLTDVHVWRWEGRCQELGGTGHGTWSLPGMVGSRMRAVGAATATARGWNWHGKVVGLRALLRVLLCMCVPGLQRALTVLFSPQADHWWFHCQC